MRPEAHTHPEYVDAFREIVLRIAATLEDVPARALPMRMYVAGGAALHFYTGARVSREIDAAFSLRIALPENLSVAFRDSNGVTRGLYLDLQYNDTLGLMHEDAQDDSRPLRLAGVDSRILDVRLLAPVDLAVSKLARYTEQDQNDIAALARKGLLKPEALRRRATEALEIYVGNTSTVASTIKAAVKLVESEIARIK